MGRKRKQDEASSEFSVDSRKLGLGLQLGVLASADIISPSNWERSREHSLITMSFKPDSSSRYDSKFDDNWPWNLHADGILERSRENSKKFRLGRDVLNLDNFGFVEKYNRTKSVYFAAEICGSVKGLVCLYHRQTKEVCLWNPASGVHRILPKHRTVFNEMESHCARDVVVGFGFDLKRNSHKVILLTEFRAMGHQPKKEVKEEEVEKKEVEEVVEVEKKEVEKKFFIAQVYDLRRDKWLSLGSGKLLVLDGDPFPHTTGGVYSNGNYYFMANTANEDTLHTDSNTRVLVKWDFVSNQSNMIELPKHTIANKLSLSNCGNSIAIFIKYPDSTRKLDFFQISVLNEKEEWDELPSFEIQHTDKGERHTPIGMSEDMEFVIIKTVNSETGFCKKMKLYHLENKKVVTTFLSCSAVMQNAFPYQPSNFSVESEIELVREKKKEQHQEQQKKHKQKQQQHQKKKKK